LLTSIPNSLVRQSPPRLTRETRTRVLVDLSHAAAGYVGVAQDVRLVFAMLCRQDGIDVSGLLMPTGRHDLPRLHAGHADPLALTAAVLHWMERNWDKPERRFFPLSLLQHAQTIRQLVRARHNMLPLTDQGQLNAVWRVLFAKTLPNAQRAEILSRSFFATDLSVSSILDLCTQKPRPWRKHLEAAGFHAVLFCMPRPVRLPRGVRSIIRYHDSVPLTDADTVVNWRAGLAHSRLVRACAPDAIFVCNSPQSQESLVRLDPARARHAVVIPCAVAPPEPCIDGISAADIVARRISFRAIGRGNEAAPPAGWLPPRPDMRYVLSVSTLEPRKNFPGLVRAWERVTSRGDPELRLIIVGGPGWREESVLPDLRPGVASGRILHLQNLAREELQALMHHAACFAFPSFNEGFGYAPLEAMQAGAACVVSDLPVFHWVFGDSAIYVDPYDTQSIASGIERLTQPGAGALAAQLRARGERVLARFRPAVVGEAWEALLETLR
jgi:glycosyltransferase involved in cell wall biosynthesis